MNSTRKPVRVYGREFYERPNRLAVLAYVVDRCGYRCDYCYNPRPRSGVLVDLGKLASFIRQIAEKYGKEIYLDLIGGETTDHPGLLDFAEEVPPSVSLTAYSNFSKDVQVYRRLIGAGYGLILTYHPHVDPEEFLGKFAGFAESDYGKIVSLPIMYMPGFSDRSIYVFDQMKKRFPAFKALDFSLLDANPNFPDVKYSEKELAEFNARSSQSEIRNTVVEYSDGSRDVVNDNYFFSNRGRLDFKFWKCNAGLDYLYVHHDGTVHPCDENDGVVLYDVNRGGDFAFPKRPVICQRHDCPCLFDVYKESVFK